MYNYLLDRYQNVNIFMFLSFGLFNELILIHFNFPDHLTMYYNFTALQNNIIHIIII